MFPVCAPVYLAGRGGAAPPLALAELPGHRLLHHVAEPQDWLDWDGWLERQGVGWRVGSRGAVFDSYPVMVQAAVEGHGVALGWRRTAEGLLRTGALVRPFAESVPLPNGLSVYQGRRHGRVRPEAQALLAWLKGELAP